MIHDEIRMEVGFRPDLVVNGKVIVEVKSVETTAPVHKMQLLTYLRVADMRLGLLINFGQALIKTGISRVVNRLHDLSVEGISRKDARRQRRKVGKHARS